jgi:hypothetical protein
MRIIFLTVLTLGIAGIMGIISCKSGSAASTPGTMDKKFGQDGVSTFQAGSVEEMAAFPNGDFVVMTFDAEGPEEKSRFVYTIHKFTSRGLPDTSYGTNGSALVRDFRVQRLRLAADGGILLAAQKSRTDLTKFLLRLTPQGVLDSSFGQNGIVEIADSKGLSFVDFDLGKTTGSIVFLGTRDSGEQMKIVVKRFSSKGEPDLSWKGGQADVDFSRPAWEFLKKPTWMAPASLALDPLLEHIFIGGTLYEEAQPHMAILKLMSSTGSTGMSGHGVTTVDFGPRGLVWEGAGAIADLWVSREDDSVHAFGIDTNPMDKWIGMDIVYDRKGQSLRRDRIGRAMDFQSAFTPDGRLILVTDREKISWKGLEQPVSFKNIRAIATTEDGRLIVAEQEDSGRPVSLKRLSL